MRGMCSFNLEVELRGSADFSWKGVFTVWHPLHCSETTFTESCNKLHFFVYFEHLEISHNLNSN